MNSGNGGLSCQMGCWVLAAAAGFLTFILLLTAGGQGFIASVFLGGVLFVLLGLLLNWLFCAPIPKPGESSGLRAVPHDDAAHGRSTSGVAGGAAAAAGGASAASGSGATASDGAAASGGAASGSGGSASAGAGATGAAATAGGSAAAGADAPSGSSAAADGSMGADGGTASASAATSAGGAASGGSNDGSSAGSGSDGDAAGGASAPDDGASAATKTAAGNGGAAAAGAAATSVGASSAVKPSPKLSGQDDLAGRKGSWSYDKDSADGGTETASSGTSGDDAESASAGGSSGPGDGGAQDYDKDGVNEGTDEGVRPQMLDSAREGGPDNLKEIKGIGPKLEQLCHSLGVYHFDQIASWGAQEVAWMDANLQGFRGRVSRDDWVGQAKILAAGGDTEFSARVDKGEVY